MNTQDPKQPQAGYFGKMPARGDFLSSGLPRDFIDPWDDWIMTSFEQSRSRLGEQWLDVYLTSPIWCFALGPSICGDHPWGGILMPSVDAVGRYFPLTIAAPLAADTNVFSMASTAGDWFAQAEALARTALNDDIDLTAFEHAIAGLGMPRGLSAPAEGDGAVVDGEQLSNAWRYGMPAANQAHLNCPALLHEALGRLLFSYSLWWTNGSARVAPSYLFCQGMPPPEGYAAMLDGGWQQWGWDDRHVIEAGLPAAPFSPSGG